MKSADNVLNELKKEGYKSTKYRKALLELLFSTEAPIAVYEILEQFSAQDLDPNKTTVYRELDFLIEHGVVKELDLGDDKKRYELAHLDHHHHLICTECKSIEDVVVEENLHDIESRIARKNQFKVTDHTMEFYGLCKNCQ